MADFFRYLSVDLGCGFRAPAYESDALRKAWAVSGRKVLGFCDEVGQGGRDRTYAEPGVGRFGGSIGVSGRIVCSFPDRTSELGLNFPERLLNGSPPHRL